ncbi:MAG: molybdenum cofactor biosynthesis protein B [Polyangiaceae bacterium]|nr:molybdenum cofactor biosynthesis protein B [Polyangiaceae bacterium]
MSSSSLNMAVITVSDTRSLETDKSGAALVEYVESAGHCLQERVILVDDLHEIRATVKRYAQSDAVDVILLTGGTGITQRDVTPEALEPLWDKVIPGFGELFRQLSYEDIGPSTIQSRAIGGVISSTLAFALPGSTGAVRLAIDSILRSQLDINTRPCNFVQLMPRI